MTDHSAMKLGRKPRNHKLRVPCLAPMVAEPFNPPASADWHSRVSSWPMMLNDRLGICTLAALAHAIQQWSTYAGTPLIVSDALVEALYERFGYVPDDPSTDNGAVEADVLAAWSKGIPTGGAEPDVLTGFAEVQPHNHAEVKQTIAWFANLYIGLALPLSAQTQAVWDVLHGGTRNEGEAGSWGGHAVLVVGYDAQGLVCVTWGALKRMTWAFWDAYCDEAYALLSRDFVTAASTAAGAVAWAQLEADMARIRA